MKVWAAVAALALAVAASAQSGVPNEVVLDFNLDPGVEITDAVVAEITPAFGAYTLINTFAFSGSGSTVVDSDADPAPKRLGVAGRYTKATDSLLNGEGVALFLNKSLADEIVGTSWDSIFPDFAEDLIDKSLLDIQNDGDPAAQQTAVNNLFDFFSTYGDYFPEASPSAGAWVGFSSANNLGSGSWTTNAVPEPGIMAAAVLGGIALLHRRRS
jgi:hypothetical protein